MTKKGMEGGNVQVTQPPPEERTPKSAEVVSRQGEKKKNMASSGCTFYEGILLGYERTAAA